MKRAATKEQIIDVGIQIVDIKTLAFRICEWFVLDTDEPVQLRLTHQVGYFAEEDIVFLKVRCYAHYEQEDMKDRILVDMEVENQFRVENLSKYLVDKTDNLPLQVWIHMIAVSIGHVRALLADRVRGTRLNGIILPIMDPVEVTRTYMPQRFANTKAKVAK